MKYTIDYTNNFKKQYKKIKKQGKDLSKLHEIIEKLANGEKLDNKYRNHKLIDNNFFKSCNECHISPDWLLIYRLDDNELILLLIATGSHSILFNC